MPWPVIVKLAIQPRVDYTGATTPRGPACIVRAHVE